MTIMWCVYLAPLNVVSGLAFHIYQPPGSLWYLGDGIALISSSQTRRIDAIHAVLVESTCRSDCRNSWIIESPDAFQGTYPCSPH